MKRIILPLTILTLASQTFAWDGIAQGKITHVDVTGGENYGFRVSIDDPESNIDKTLCGNNNTWAYVLKSDSNYETYVSVLLAAKLADRTVTIHSNRDSDNGYCHIGYVTMS